MNIDKEFKNIEAFFSNLGEIEFDNILEKEGIEIIKASSESNMQLILNDKSVYMSKNYVYNKELNNNKYSNSDIDYLAS